MATTESIGAVGWTYGQGRVAAITKAITSSDIKLSTEEVETYKHFSFSRMLLNLILWATSQDGRQGGSRYITNRCAFFTTENVDFDQRISSLISSTTFFSSVVQIPTPWYEITQSNFPVSVDTANVILLFPTYNAKGGSRMDDWVQEKLLTLINRGAGFIVSEWFHYLQSVSAKRSFSYSYDSSNGLFTASPIVINPNSTFIFTDTDSIVYNYNTSSRYKDSLTPSIPNSFILDNIEKAGFDGNAIKAFDTKADSVTFWRMDTSKDNILIGTTTTTTTPAPEPTSGLDIKLKISDIIPNDDCGPYNLYIRGDEEYLQYLKLEGHELFLVKEPLDPVLLKFEIVFTDHFIPKRFPDFIESVEIDTRFCFGPITLPLDKTYPAYSYRMPCGPLSVLDFNGILNNYRCGDISSPSYNIKDVWGDGYNVGPITPFTEWSFKGEGTVENPSITTLGGKHSDNNAIWLQLNNAGTVNINIDIDTAYTISNTDGGSVTYDNDFARAYFIQNTTTSNVTPSQHLDFWNLNQDNPSVVSLLPGINSLGGNVIRTQNTFPSFSTSINVLDPNEIDQFTGERVRGNAYLVLVFQKHSIRSDFSDKITMNAYYGSIVTTPPPDRIFRIYIVNNVPDSYATHPENFNLLPTENGFPYIDITSPVTDNILTESFNIRYGSTLVYENFSVTDNSDRISTTQSDVQSLNYLRVNVSLDGMTDSGGSAVITINAVTSTTTTTTTTPAPIYNVTVTITNKLDKVTVYRNFTGLFLPNQNDSGQLIISGTAGSNPSNNVDWYTDSGYTYYNNNKPSVTIVSSNVTLSYSVGTINSGSSGYITFTVTNMPVSGGVAEVEIGLPEPVPVTTTTTTTTGPPCDDLVYIYCKQTLVCEEDTEGNCQPTNASYQSLVYDTCCDVTEAQVLQAVADHYGYTSITSLYDVSELVSQCNASSFTTVGPCGAKDELGNCTETDYYITILTLNCP